MVRGGLGIVRAALHGRLLHGLRGRRQLAVLGFFLRLLRLLLRRRLLILRLLRLLLLLLLLLFLLLLLLFLLLARLLLLLLLLLGLLLLLLLLLLNGLLARLGFLRLAGIGGGGRGFVSAFALGVVVVQRLFVGAAHVGQDRLLVARLGAGAGALALFRLRNGVQILLRGGLGVREHDVVHLLVLLWRRGLDLHRGGDGAIRVAPRSLLAQGDAEHGGQRHNHRKARQQKEMRNDGPADKEHRVTRAVLLRNAFVRVGPQLVQVRKGDSRGHLGDGRGRGRGGAGRTQGGALPVARGLLHQLLQLLVRQARDADAAQILPRRNAGHFAWPVNGMPARFTLTLLFGGAARRRS
ncbi:hypothetical protein DB346_06940 [Verrucomicrobia bacterium LW23]|nr:hypothetical protein DB346_06940 [Verrucomicrobia bacterium LW23]